MDNIKTEIFACSVARMSCRMKLYGDADIVRISLLKVLYKYQEYLGPEEEEDVPNQWQDNKKGILLDLERKLVEGCRDICRSHEISKSPVIPGSPIIPSESGIFDDPFGDEFA